MKRDINLPHDYFGLCPECKQQPLCISIQKNDFGVCKDCRAYWKVGFGNFTPCFDKVENNRRKKMLMTFKEVKSFHWGCDDMRNTRHWSDPKTVLDSHINDEPKDLPF